MRYRIKIASLYMNSLRNHFRLACAVEEAWMSDELLEAPIEGAPESVGKKRGGVRPGAGRKAERGETTVMRIPAAYKGAILALIAHLDATAEINRYYAPVESEPLFMRSLKGRAQWLTFRTAPVHGGEK